MSRYFSIAAAVFATLSLVALALYLYPVLVLILLSLGVAGAMRPLVDHLGQKGMPRWLAASLAYGTVLTVLGSLLLLAAPPLAGEVANLLNDADLAYQNATATWDTGSPAQRFLARYLPLLQQPWAAIQRGDMNGIVHVLHSTAELAEVFALLGAAIVLSVYWTLDRVHFERLWLSLLPLTQRVATRDAWRELEREVGAYLRSEAVQCVASGLLLGVGFRLTGFPYPTLLALCAAFAWLIPWAGIVVALAAAVAMSLPAFAGEPSTSAWLPLAAAVALIAAVFLLLEIWLEPKLFNRRRYNPLLLVLVVMVLAETFGLAGLLLGPPLAVMVQVLVRSWLRLRLAPAAPAVETDELSDRVAELRERLRQDQASSPEMTSLVDRLTDLVEEVQETEDAAVVQQQPSAGWDS